MIPKHLFTNAGAEKDGVHLKFVKILDEFVRFAWVLIRGFLAKLWGQICSRRGATDSFTVSAMLADSAIPAGGIPHS